MDADLTRFGWYLVAAVVLAVTPGPGIFYVLVRSLHGGRREGIISTGGSTVGGLAHVAAGAVGVSALLATSAVLFGALKIAGALYLIYLGVQALRERDHAPLPVDLAAPAAGPTRGAGDAFRQGVLSEVLNPKTALFFLAFIPPFIDPAAGLPVPAQFLLLGSLSVALNSAADLVVALAAGSLAAHLQSPRWGRWVRRFKGGSFIGLGVTLGLSDAAPATP